MPSAAAARRMDPERRREHLLEVAGQYIAEHGTAVSLDDIAKEAGISPPLMRHYFKNRDGLLVALTERAVVELETIFLAPGGGDLGDRLRRYLDWVPANQWSHWLWVASASRAAATDFTPTRKRLMAAAIMVPYEEQEPAQRIRVNAWVAAIESTVTTWLEQGEPDRDEVVEALLDIAARLDVNGAKAALRSWRRQRSRQT